MTTARIEPIARRTSDSAALAPNMALRLTYLGARNHVIKAASLDTPVYLIHGHGSVHSLLTGWTGYVGGATFRFGARLETFMGER